MKLLLTQLNFLQGIIAKGSDYYILHDFWRRATSQLTFINLPSTSTNTDFATS
ncbi:hypothetical protein VBZ67_10205 [Campylobacter concisus]